MQITVDRIEGEVIVAELENGDMLDLPLIIAPEAKEGDIINITIDHEAAEQRREDIRGLMNRLWEDES